MHTYIRILALVLALAMLGSCGGGSGFERPQYFLGGEPTGFGGADGAVPANQLVAAEILGGRRFDLSPNSWIIESGVVTSSTESIDNDFGAGEGEQNIVSSTGSIDMRIISRDAALREVRLFGIYDIGSAALANNSPDNTFDISWTVSWQDLTSAYSVTCTQTMQGQAFQDTGLF